MMSWVSIEEIIINKDVAFNETEMAYKSKVWKGESRSSYVKVKGEHLHEATKRIMFSS